MKTAIKPMADRLLATKEEAQTQTASGLYLPDDAREKSVVATVEAIGPEVKNIKVGDRIIYKEYSTSELKLDGKEYIIVKEEDVLATV